MILCYTLIYSPSLIVIGYLLLFLTGWLVPLFLRKKVCLHNPFASQTYTFHSIESGIWYPAKHLSFRSGNKLFRKHVRPPNAKVEYFRARRRIKYRCPSPSPNLVTLPASCLYKPPYTMNKQTLLILILLPPHPTFPPRTPPPIHPQILNPHI